MKYQKRLDVKINRTIWPTAVDSQYKHNSGKITNPWLASARTLARKLGGQLRDFFLAGASESVEEMCQKVDRGCI